MITSDMLQFLYELSQNNNKDWFEKNKKRYEDTVKKPFDQTVEEIISRIERFEPEFNLIPKDCTYRIYRDTRFSNDKTPYKTHVAAVFSKGGKKNMAYPGYYLHLEYGNLMVGGGGYFLEKEPLHRIRTHIAQDPDTFRELIQAPAFKNRFGDLKGEVNKVLPPEFKETAKKEPLLAHKQFYFMAELDPELALRADFPDLVGAYFEAARPFNEFLRKAIYE
jgi:uncharacterized protein (TIGR02453 family)